ncbi:biopolymer transporter ExbD [Helicobacter sp. 13S00477-4]|uniref:ExbD/TolR family protein n=1 Tax=Helicobacter sp. 13S00477-4 TaxID=1905759 RepID=UPI000BA762C3|nr:biopolymer transporter ExbD [Helicobacter sp. 13S00477-4]PAF52556.1 biopolymer transporter ExbD [Helicobacter sp. 13S00477-4]
MKKMDSMNLVPFIDIMLVLLVIVLTTASFVSTSKLPINIPKVDENSSHNQKEPNKKQVRISISNDGNYFIDDKKVSFNQLKNTIASYSKDTPIVLQGDKDSNLDSFIKVVDLLQSNNLKELYILVEDKDKSK